MQKIFDAPIFSENKKDKNDDNFIRIKINNKFDFHFLKSMELLWVDNFRASQLKML